MFSKVFYFYTNIFFAVLFTFSINFLSEKKLLANETSYIRSYYGSILAGQIANYNNDSEKSADFFNYASDINPANDQIYNLALMSLIVSGDIKSAIKKIEQHDKKFGKASSKSVIANFITFVGNVKQQKYKEALKELDKNENFLITEKMKPILKAWLLSDLEQATEAINNYEYKSDGLALSNIYFHHLALLQNYHNNQTLAKNTFEKHLEFFDLDKLRTLYFYSGFIIKNYKNNVLNNEYISQFLKENEDHYFSDYLKQKNKLIKTISSPSEGISETLYNLARTLYTQNMNETSLALAQTSLFLDPNNHMVKYLIFLNLNNLNKKKLSMGYLKSIPEGSYISWNATISLANLYIDLKNYDLATQFLKKLANKNNKKVEVFYKLGEMFHAQKKYDNAINYFSKAISSLNKIEKKYWYLYYSRGMSYERSAKWKLAEKDFLYSLELSPDEPLTLNYLGYTWIDLGKNIEKAHKLIIKAVGLRPKDGYFVDSLGWAYYRMGEYKKAVTELEKAVGLVPNDPIINDHLGDALWRAGYKNEAVYQWKRALIYKPENELKEEILFKLKQGL